MLTPSRRAARLSMTVLATALAFWIVSGSSALAHGGGGGGGHGGGGGGHGGGGHSGGHSGGHYSGGSHYGGYHPGGYHYGGRGYSPIYYGGFGFGRYGYGGYGGYGYGGYGGYGYSSYPGYGYGYYGNGYSYPYTDYGYSYPSYTDASGYVASGRFLGIDEVAVVDAGVPGMQVTAVYPGSAAAQAGLQVGDVIHSANGYLTQQHGNLTWIIANMPANGVLQMSVRTSSDGLDQVISAQIP